MDQAIHDYIMPDYKVIELAAVAMAADAEFIALLTATPDAIGADDAAIAAILEGHHEACVALAALPAVTLAGWQAKALALAPVVLRTRAHPATLDDDTGLAASLIVDLIRAA